MRLTGITKGVAAYSNHLTLTRSVPAATRLTGCVLPWRLEYELHALPSGYVSTSSGSQRMSALPCGIPLPG